MSPAKQLTLPGLLSLLPSPSLCRSSPLPLSYSFLPLGSHIRAPSLAVSAFNSGQAIKAKTFSHVKYLYCNVVVVIVAIAAAACCVCNMIWVLIKRPTG